MSTSLQIAAIVIPAIVTVVGPILGYRQVTKKTTLEHSEAIRSVDAAAFDRAKEIYESAIKHLQQQIEQLEEQAERLRKTVNSQETDNEQLKLEVDELRRLVLRLKQELERAGIHIDWDSEGIAAVRKEE